MISINILIKNSWNSKIIFKSCLITWKNVFDNKWIEKTLFIRLQSIKKYSNRCCLKTAWNSPLTLIESAYFCEPSKKGFFWTQAFKKQLIIWTAKKFLGVFNVLLYTFTRRALNWNLFLFATFFARSSFENKWMQNLVFSIQNMYNTKSCKMLVKQICVTFVVVFVVLRLLGCTKKLKVLIESECN